MGFLISLSSTAIVLKVLQERNEVYTPHGKTSLAILIFQDLAIVPLILLTPLLAGSSVNFEGSFSTVFLKGSLIILVFILSAKFLVPRIFYYVGRTGNKELFLVSVVFICLSAAVFTSSIGLSLGSRSFFSRDRYIRFSIQPAGNGQYRTFERHVHELLFRVHRYASGYRVFA